MLVCVIEQKKIIQKSEEEFYVEDFCLEENSGIWSSLCLLFHLPLLAEWRCGVV